MKSTLPAFAALLLSFAVGCSVATEGDGASGSSSAAATVDQASGDVTVSQAWIGQTIGRRYENGYQLGDLALNLRRCGGTDCTSGAQDLLASELAGTFSYDENSSGQCETVEIRTVIRKSALEAATFKGIGLYVSGRGFLFVDKNRLNGRAYDGDVTLSSGAPGVVHKFVVQGTCMGLGGNGGSLYRRGYSFKPYAQYDDGTNTYRNWDDVASDYYLGRASDGAWVSGFERRGDALNR